MVWCKKGRKIDTILSKNFFVSDVKQHFDPLDLKLILSINKKCCCCCWVTNTCFSVTFYTRCFHPCTQKISVWINKKVQSFFFLLTDWNTVTFFSIFISTLSAMQLSGCEINFTNMIMCDVGYWGKYCSPPKKFFSLIQYCGFSSSFIHLNNEGKHQYVKKYWDNKIPSYNLKIDDNNLVQYRLIYCWCTTNAFTNVLP